MSLPQGINFRSTLSYVTDGANEEMENDSGGGGNANYPHTTANGIVVGWETTSSTYQARDRNAGNDRRLAGINFNGTAGKFDYRIDVPSAGNYDIIVAMGDPSYAQTVDCEIFDGASSLGVIISGSTGAANSFKDQRNSTWTAANFFANTSPLTITLTGTILRFRFGSAGGTTGQVAHIKVAASAGAGGLPFFMQSDLLNGGLQSLAGGFQ